MNGALDKRHISKRWMAVAVVLALLLAGCFPTSTFQTPEILPPGERVVGFGFTTSEEYWLLPGSEAYGRWGIESSGPKAGRMDVGVKLTGFPLEGIGLYGDVKYQFQQEPARVAGVLGASIVDMGPNVTKKETGYRRVQIHLHPTLVAGNDHLYFGAKLIVPPPVDTFSTRMVPAAFLGLSAGGIHWRILPEATVVFRKDGTQSILAGVAVQFDGETWEAIEERFRKRRSKRRR